MRKIVCLMLAVIAAFAAVPGTMSQETPTLWVSPQLDYTAVGSSVLCECKLTNAPLTYGLSVAIMYDNTYLEILEDNVIEGEFYRSDGVPTGFFKKVSVDKANPKISRLYVGVSRIMDKVDSYGPTSGSGLVFYFSAKTKFVGEAALAFGSVKMVNIIWRQGEPVIEYVPLKLEESKIVVRAKDTSAPIVTFSRTPLPETNENINTFEWIGQDDSTPPNKLQYSYKLDDPAVSGEWSKWEARTSAAIAFTREGNNIFCVRARDEWGNISKSTCFTTNFDITPPKLVINPIPKETDQENFTVLGTTDKPDTGVTLFINGARVPINAEGNFSYPTRLVAGTNTVHIYAVDKAGNVAQQYFSITLLQVVKIKLWVDIPTAEVNGQRVSVTPVPAMVKGRVMIPMKFVTTAFGMKIDYSATDKKITVTWSSKDASDLPITHKLQMWINKKFYNLDGKTVTKNMDVPPQIVKGYTMVPFRALSEAIGAQVDWFSSDKRVELTYIVR